MIEMIKRMTSLNSLFATVVVVSLVWWRSCSVVQGQDVSENGRSLVIVFDTTWSMDDDLQELRAGAAHIVREMMKKEKNPIYNYVFVPFNDPCELSFLNDLDLEYLPPLSLVPLCIARGNS